ncbi:MAG: sigma-54 dependent transcriptional regulator [Acidobacteriota bacterium]|nr:sigma-54 dependent transcriptional regulator [Acidobacteriota bacterium]
MGAVSSLLLVDDDPFALESLSAALTRAGFDVDVAASGADALQRLGRRRYDLHVVDIVMSPMDGLELMRRVREVDGKALLLVVTGDASQQGAVAAMRAGASDYLAKPFHVKELVDAARRVLETARRQGDEPGAPVVDPAPQAPLEFEDLIGSNSRMQRVYRLIKTVAAANSTVLIMGDSGTGKERVAEAIHRRSSRRGGPFVRVNCSAFAEGVLESELFGHEAGSFTGAIRARPGVFRKASGGTLFLDEIGDIPSSTQVKLLRVIQEREVQPVGGDAAVQVNVRLIAATNRDLTAEVKAGRLREDLYFRLNVIPVHLPSLRERPDDVPHLAQHFLSRFAAECGKEVRGFTERALSAMEKYAWPGNVRELENAVERSVVLAADEVIDLVDLPPELRGGGAVLEGTFQVNTVRLSEVEEIVVRRVLTRNGWNIKRSAEMLGITRATLYSKIRKFGLTVAR